MLNKNNVFHLAIPCRDLDEARHYYVDQLECKLARRYEDRITRDFFGDQLVCHLSPDKIARDPRILGAKGALDRRPAGMGVKGIPAGPIYPR